LHTLVTEEQDLRRWPDGFRRICADHINHERVALEAEDEDPRPLQELGRQIKVTRKKAAQLESSTFAIETDCRADVVQKTEENSELIKELAELRKEVQILQRQSKNLDLQVHHPDNSRTLASPPPALADVTSAMPQASPVQAARKSASVPDLQPLAGAFVGGDMPRVNQRFVGGGPALGPQQAPKRPVSHLPAAERQKAQKLLATADLHQQQIRMQRLEHKILEDQLEHLKLHPTAGAAGAGLAAVRRRAS
jgi:hypothetical protein